MENNPEMNKIKMDNSKMKKANESLEKIISDNNRNYTVEIN